MAHGGIPLHLKRQTTGNSLCLTYPLNHTQTLLGKEAGGEGCVWDLSNNLEGCIFPVQSTCLCLGPVYLCASNMSFYLHHFTYLLVKDDVQIQKTCEVKALRKCVLSLG